MPRFRYHAPVAMRLLALWVVFLLVACQEESLEPVPSRAVLLSEGNYALAFLPERSVLELRRGGQLLVTLPLTRLMLRTVDQPDPNKSYDPWLVLSDPQSPLNPPDYVAHAVTGATLLEADTVHFALGLEHAGGLSSRLDVTLVAEGRFRCVLTAGAGRERVVHQSVGLEVQPDEAFYGLGEYFDDVNQRGKLRAMQLEGARLESGYNEAHVPVPLLIGTRGWGLFVESSRAGVFDVASRSGDQVESVFASGAPDPAPFVFHLLAAEQPLDVTYRYYQLTGFPKLPAPWAYGPLVWRDENDDQAQVESDLRTMRDLDLPTSGIWIDRPYASAVNTFDFESAAYPDPAAMISLANALGFRVALWHTPYLDESSPLTEALRDEAKAGGFYPLMTGLNLNSWGKILDLSTPDTRAFWQGKLGAYRDLGIEGFKLDYGEDVVPDLIGARNQYLFRNGEDERTMQRGYTLAYHQTYAEVLPEDGGFLLCRAGKWGDQIHGCVIWPGDLDARFWRHDEQVEVDGKSLYAVGGLPASVVAGLTLGPSGFPFYGADTGGYRHSPPDKETFRRWFEQTALSTVMQIGTSSNDVAWEFGDAELLASYRDFTRLHLRLFPYVWSLAHELSETGRPIQRPFGLAEPELGEHPSDEYFFGDALLVAPVLEAGKDTRELLIPDGGWLGYFDGASFDGPGATSVSAPLGTLPLFQRAGSLVPLLRPNIDTLSPVLDATAIESFANDAGKLYLRMAMGPEGERRLYDGSAFAQVTEGALTTLLLQSGSTFDRGAVIEIYGFGELPPREVSLDVSPVVEVFDPDSLALEARAFVFRPDEARGTLRIAVPAGSHELRVVRSL